MTDQPRVNAAPTAAPSGQGRADYGVGAALTGSVIWAVALLGALVFQDRLVDRGLQWLAATCVVGVLIGLVMFVLFRRRRAVYEGRM